MDYTKEKMISLNELYSKYSGPGKPISWISSYPTLRKWVLRDLSVNNFLGTKVLSPLKGNTGKRYLIPIKNIDTFVRSLYDGTIYAKNKGRTKKRK